MCKFTDAAGVEWCQCLMEGLNEIWDKTVQILGGATSIDGMGTLPKTRKTKKKLL